MGSATTTRACGRRGSDHGHALTTPFVTRLATCAVMAEILDRKARDSRCHTLTSTTLTRIALVIPLYD